MPTLSRKGRTQINHFHLAVNASTFILLVHYRLPALLSRADHRFVSSLLSVIALFFNVERNLKFITIMFPSRPPAMFTRHVT